MNAKNKKIEANFAIHKEFIMDTYDEVRNIDLSGVPTQSDYCAVIIEPREHPHLEYAIRNVMHFLGSGWSLYIVGSRVNQSFIKNIVNGIGAASIEILDVDNLSRAEFRALRKSAGYWQRLPGKKLLCFEVDALLCRAGIDEFLQYDYIGAPWSPGIAISDVVRVGNGGMSLRSRQAMIDMCERGKPRVIPSEDSFFSIQLHLHKDEYQLPDVDTAMRFSVETTYYPEPLGLHKPWPYLSKAEMLTIYDSIRY